MHHTASPSEGHRRMPFANNGRRFASTYGRGSPASGSGGGLLERRNGGVSGGRQPSVLLPGDEYALAGGTSGYGNGDRHRSGKATDSDRGRRKAVAATGPDRATRSCDRVQNLCRGSRKQFLSFPRQNSTPANALGTRRSR